MPGKPIPLLEINFDGLASPAHNYSGLASGNLASERSKGLISRPRDAALQGWEKMKTLAEWGVPQAFLPPQLRPSIPALRRLGFHGDDRDVLRDAFEQAPEWFAACSSASSMWTANAAAVAPSSDTADGRVHFVPANLSSNFHRSIETKETAKILQTIFPPGGRFVHHQPLPATPLLADEGAANHIRLCAAENRNALHVFVYGTDRDAGQIETEKFPPRQTRQASQAVARLLCLSPDHVLFIRQNPKAIDAGVFHNDVISVGHEDLFLFHEEAFAEPNQAISSICDQFGGDLQLVEVPSSEVSLDDAVATYLFNSQIVSLHDGSKLLISPVECRENPKTAKFIQQKIVEGNNSISQAIFLDLRQSMQNGGGPACLRLRVRLTEKETAKLPPRTFFNAETESWLREWIERNYPEELKLDDLASHQTYLKNAAALEELRAWMIPD